MWEYVKGSEADFEGAPDWATLRTYCGGRSFYAEHHNKGAQIYDICAKNTFFFNNEFADLSTISVTAERRKVDDLQSRTNDANLQQSFDTVQRPAHYNQSGIECIDAIAAAVKGKSGIEAALVSNVIKYLWRYELKNGVEDVRKAQWYLDRLVKELSK